MSNNKDILTDLLNTYRKLRFKNKYWIWIASVLLPWNRSQNCKDSCIQSNLRWLPNLQAKRRQKWRR